MLLTLGLDEVDHLAVVLEHVHLLDGRDVGDTDPLEGRCELLVVCSKKKSRRKRRISRHPEIGSYEDQQMAQNPLRTRN